MGVTNLDSLTLSGDLILTGDLQLGSSVTVVSSLTVGTAFSVGSNATFSGSATFNSAVSVNGAENVVGSLTVTVLKVNSNSTFTGTITPNGGIVGFASSTAPAVGTIGEEIISTISSLGNMPATTVFGDLTSIDITAGCWDISYHVQFAPNASTSTTSVSFGVGTAAGSLSTGLSGATNFTSMNADVATALIPALQGHTQSLACYRVNLASTTTHYLKMTATFASGTPQARGTIRAHRRA